MISYWSCESVREGLLAIGLLPVEELRRVPRRHRDMNRHSVPNATLGLPGKPANGGSQPRFYDFDDGVTRLVKWWPSPHGNKACFNELVASRLGQLIDAPIL
jgi:hypothetical protein